MSDSVRLSNLLVYMHMMMTIDKYFFLESSFCIKLAIKDKENKFYSISKQPAVVKGN
jgi:hypothetical protein